MDGKRILVLSLALLVLLAIAYLSGIFGGDVSTIQTPGVQLKDAELQSLLLRKDGVEIALEKQQDIWVLTQPVSAEADTGRVASFVRDLKGITSETVVSTNPERHARYEVDEQKAILVRLGYGDESDEVYIGKTGPDMQSRYIRHAGDDRVVEATGVPAIIVSQDNWRNKKLWDISEADLASVEVQRPDEQYSLLHAGQSWHVVADATQQPADSVGVSRFLDLIGTLTVDGFFPELDVDSVRTTADHALKLSFQDGSTRHLNILKRENDVAVTLDDGLEVYKLFTYRLTQLVPPLSDVAR